MRVSVGDTERTVQGTVIAGYGVASGRCPDPRFPGGTIALQAPVFRARGVDLAVMLGTAPFLGTINIDVAPLVPTVASPEVVLRDVAWCDAVPPETFWLFSAMLDHAGARYPALVYRPDPTTKPDHIQPATVLEVIAPFVPGLSVGDAVRLSLPGGHLLF